MILSETAHGFHLKPVSYLFNKAMFPCHAWNLQNTDTFINLYALLVSERTSRVAFFSQKDCILNHLVSLLSFPK